MPDVPVIGDLSAEELADLEALDGKPFVLEYSAYTRGSHERVAERFRFHPSQTTGDYFAIIEAVQNGGVNDGVVHRYVRNSLLNDGERDRFQAFISRPDLINPPSNIGLLFNALREYYTDRPTWSPTGSPSARSPRRRTSSAARGSRASASKTSRPR